MNMNGFEQSRKSKGLHDCDNILIVMYFSLVFYSDYYFRLKSNNFYFNQGNQALNSLLGTIDTFKCLWFSIPFVCDWLQCLTTAKMCVKTFLVQVDLNRRFFIF